MAAEPTTAILIMLADTTDPDETKIVLVRAAGLFCAKFTDDASGVYG